MLRITLLTIGILSLILGVLGIFLPILPTTPFILLAAACFARSSDRFYHWLINHRHFGSTIRNWEQNRSITLKGKVMSIGFLNLSMALSIFAVKPNLHLLILLLIIDVAVTIFLLSIPIASPPGDNEDLSKYPEPKEPKE